MQYVCSPTNAIGYRQYFRSWRQRAVRDELYVRLFHFCECFNTRRELSRYLPTIL